jgi:hypothetical protein
MTKLLQQAFETAAQLPPEEQDSFARWILHELESEQRWNDLFARSQDVLAKMADDALAELKAGKTLPLDPETL